MRRVMWRAGFGATEHEAAKWSHRGRGETLRWLLSPNGRKAPLLPGPKPMALDPANEYGHDVLWWMDRMVRTTRPLEEKMVLFWHDHFATRDQDTPLMLRQNAVFRRGALGSFPALLGNVMEDPAMASFLDLVDSHKDEPNENFARELMELFTLGEGNGYTESDVREAARALTGYVEGKRAGGVLLTTRFEPKNHDGGTKRIFGHKGRFGPRRRAPAGRRPPPPPRVPGPQAVVLLRRRAAGQEHAAAPAAHLHRLRAPPQAGRRRDPRPSQGVCQPRRPDDGQVAGRRDRRACCARRGLGVKTDDWTWITAGMGQRLFGRRRSPAGSGARRGCRPTACGCASSPPTSRCRSRGSKVEDGDTPVDLEPAQQLDRAMAALGHPWASARTRKGAARAGQGL